MDIAAAADWATVLAVTVTPIVGLFWWLWLRRKRQQHLLASNKIIKDAIEFHTALGNSATQMLEDNGVTDIHRIHSLQLMLWADLVVLVAYIQADFMLTHEKLPITPHLKLQWPIVPDSTS